MNRDKMIYTLKNSAIKWDVVIIGGGATGLGIAVDSASRGFKTVLLEQADFGKSTSGKSSKLIHGGLRYLKSGNFSLVKTSLKERYFLNKNAPHLVSPLPFIIPVYNSLEKFYFGVGVKLYKFLGGKYNLGPIKYLSKNETIKRLPGVISKNLKGGILYHDAQFNDNRLLINLAQTAVDHNAIILNYVKVLSLQKNNGNIDGVTALNIETNEKISLKSKVVINATGVFSDYFRKQNCHSNKNIIYSSRGTHLILDKSFNPCDNAIAIPSVTSSRILFILPWKNSTLIGTTDISVDDYSLNPKPDKKEIDYLLFQVGKFLIKKPVNDDIKSLFSGLRPLVKSDTKKDSLSVSRDFIIEDNKNGLITITGGKWTIYRKMAEDTLGTIINNYNLKNKPCITQNLEIHGHTNSSDNSPQLVDYGSDSIMIKKISADENQEEFQIELPFLISEIKWCVRNEMIRNIEDFLVRRNGIFNYNIKLSIEIATTVARIMAIELKKDYKWIDKQLKSFKKYVNSIMNL